MDILSPKLHSVSQNLSNIGPTSKITEIINQFECIEKPIVLFRKQNGEAWITIQREPSGEIKGFIQKYAQELQPLSIKGIASNNLKLEHVNNAKVFLKENSQVSFTDYQIDIVSKPRGGMPPKKDPLTGDTRWHTAAAGNSEELCRLIKIRRAKIPNDFFDLNKEKNTFLHLLAKHSDRYTDIRIHAVEILIEKVRKDDKFKNAVSKIIFDENEKEETMLDIATEKGSNDFIKKVKSLIRACEAESSSNSDSVSEEELSS